MGRIGLGFLVSASRGCDPSEERTPAAESRSDHSIVSARVKLVPFPVFRDPSPIFFRVPCEHPSAGQLLQKFLLVEPVLEGFAAVDEDYGDFVGELAF